MEKEIKKLKNDVKEFLKIVEDKNETKDYMNFLAATISVELDEIIAILFKKGDITWRK